MGEIKLTEQQEELLENFIANNNNNKKPEDILKSISVRDIANGIKDYIDLKKENVNYNYVKFGENGMGYTCYALYKSKNRNIYLIVISIQNPVSYAIIENEYIFMNYMPNYIQK